MPLRRATVDQVTQGCSEPLHTALTWITATMRQMAKRLSAESNLRNDRRRGAWSATATRSELVTPHLEDQLPLMVAKKLHPFIEGKGVRCDEPGEARDFLSANTKGVVRQVAPEKSPRCDGTGNNNWLPASTCLRSFEPHAAVRGCDMDHRPAAADGEIVIARL